MAGRFVRVHPVDDEGSGSDPSRASDDDFDSQSDEEDGQVSSENDESYDEEDMIAPPGGGNDSPGSSESNAAIAGEDSVGPMANGGHQSVSSTDLESRIAQMERTLATIATALDNPRPEQRVIPEDPPLPPQPVVAPVVPTDAGPSRAPRTAPISLEHIPKFPDNVPASKMWAELFMYLDQFNMALSLNNVVEPRKKAELLYLALGAQTQEVIRAAGLRPSNYEDPDCYKIFVTNIEAYFKSMTDPSAELLEFSSLKQKPGESTVQFFARVTARA